ncbi:MAG: hypothetical protein AABW91_04685 [Nanoarchaeota archaeon]
MQKYSLEFLREFTKELVINSIPKEYKEKRFEINKIKAAIEQKTNEQKEEKLIPSIFEINKGPQKTQIQITSVQKSLIKEEPEPLEQKIYEIGEVKKEGFFLGKITPMILDPRVISIECSGPGRFVIIRLPEKKLSTNVSLNKENINEIIDSFSQESRIPRIGGVFKAIVNNLIITAIDSPVSGPRFIINKTKQPI